MYAIYVGAHACQIIAAIKARQEETPLPDIELVGCIWQGLMASVDWSTRPDQIEGLALREVGVSNISFCLYPKVDIPSEICSCPRTVLQRR